MGRAINEINHSLEKNFLVFDDNDEIIGALHELFILEAIKKKDHEGPVLEYMSNKFEVISPEMSLQTLISKIREKGYSILPVFESEELKGVVDVNMLNNFLKLQQKIA